VQCRRVDQHQRRSAVFENSASDAAYDGPHRSGATVRGHDDQTCANVAGCVADRDGGIPKRHIGLRDQLGPLAPCAIGDAFQVIGRDTARLFDQLIRVRQHAAGAVLEHVDWLRFDP
jgi:hypothetical protein